MEAEADIFLVFTGFNPAVTGAMPLEELMDWHRIAVARHQIATERTNAG
ncbi:GpE family phage tail protein [Veronia pacifica]|nr:GpE family phage tail protein [Veronia pacifica]